MACDYTTLSAYMDGELDLVERRRVEAHLKECLDCAEELRSLERTRAMVTAYAIPTGLHNGLMARVHREERKRRLPSARWLAVAAVFAVVVAGVLFTHRQPPAGPGAPAVVPPTAKHETSEPQKVAQAPIAKPEAVAPAPAAQPMEETTLTLQLQGTVSGAVPQAIILRKDTGKSATYGVGDEVAPGVRLTEVRDKAVVLATADGALQVLNMGDNPPPEGKSLTGFWQVASASADASSPPEIGGCKITDKGGALTLEFIREGKVLITCQGQRSGKRIELIGEKEGTRRKLDGTVDPSFNEIRLRAVADNPADSTEDVSLVLTRMSDAEAGALLAKPSSDDARKKEVEAMLAPLVDIFVNRGEALPATLNGLVPDSVPDLSAYANRPDRTVTYIPSAARYRKFAQPYEEFQTNQPEAERMLAYEALLQETCDSETPFLIVLKVEYTNPDETYYGSAMGAVAKRPTEQAAPEQSEADIAARERAQSQNNMKQLLLISKMFANEHKGITTPGWHFVYPEYMSDAFVCSAPWEEPGTNSYELLFPAARENELEAMCDQIVASGALPHVEIPTDMNEGVRLSHLQSKVPMIIEKHANPKDPRGRNVGFLDGHVQFVKNEDWDKVVGPFIR